jgi:hypothetical protein
MSPGKLLVWGAWLFASVAGAQVPMQSVRASQPSCQLPEVMAAWRKPPASIATVTARQAGDLAGHTEQPYRVTLQPCAADWCKAGSYAAMVKVDIAQAGRYRVAVDSMLWIDLHSAGQKLEGVLCEHSGCAPLRKIVQFDVSAGPHWVTLEGREAGEVGLMVARVHP